MVVWGEGNSQSVLIRQLICFLLNLVYYIHHFLVQYETLLAVAEKDHHKTETEVGVTTTPLETTSLLNPVHIENYFRNEFFHCENSKNAKKNVAKATVSMCSTNYVRIHMKTVGKSTSGKCQPVLF